MNNKIYCMFCLRIVWKQRLEHFRRFHLLYKLWLIHNVYLLDNFLLSISSGQQTVRIKEKRWNNDYSLFAFFPIQDFTTDISSFHLLTSEPYGVQRNSSSVDAFQNTIPQDMATKIIIVAIIVVQGYFPMIIPTLKSRKLNIFVNNHF